MGYYENIFPRNLQVVRENHGLTKRQLAELLETRVSVISNWESGKTNPRSRFVKRLLELYNITFHELYNILILRDTDIQSIQISKSLLFKREQGRKKNDREKR